MLPFGGNVVVCFCMPVQWAAWSVLYFVLGFYLVNASFSHLLPISIDRTLTLFSLSFSFSFLLWRFAPCKMCHYLFVPSKTLSLFVYSFVLLPFLHWISMTIMGSLFSTSNSIPLLFSWKRFQIRSFVLIIFLLLSKCVSSFLNDMVWNVSIINENGAVEHDSN